MKKIILFLAIGCVMLLLPSAATAQDYRPMAVEGAHWIIGFHDQTNIPSLTELWEYYAHGDTLLNDLTYKKIYRRDLWLSKPNLFYPPYEPTSLFTLFGLLRDDVEERKAYAITYDYTYFNYDCPTNEEYLLYEFPLNVGDPVFFCILHMYTQEPLVVENIYETEHYGISSIKTYQLAGGFLNYYEGIGSQYGLFEDMMSTYKSSRGSQPLLEYYCLDADGSCEGLILSLEDYKTTSSIVTIIPNPAKETVRIQLTQPESITSFQICNLYGNVVHTQETNKAAEYALDISKLAAGVYLVYFYNQNHVLEVKKLLVTR